MMMMMSERGERETCYLENKQDGLRGAGRSARAHAQTPVAQSGVEQRANSEVDTDNDEAPLSLSGPLVAPPSTSSSRVTILFDSSDAHSSSPTRARLTPRVLLVAIFAPTPKEKKGETERASERSAGWQGRPRPRFFFEFLSPAGSLNQHRLLLPFSSQEFEQSLTGSQ